MGELRYTELKYNGKIYTEQWKIDEILIKNKFNWMVNAEIKNARLEIFNTTLVWNGGIWYNGDWYFGVWRDGEWRYGTWQNGVFYNGTWKNGTFKSGIIYNGHFFKGKILSGEIRGGQFIDAKISEDVIEYNNDEIITKKEDQQKQQQQQIAQQEEQTPTQSDTVKVHSTPPASQQQNIVTQPKIQEKNNYIMKKIKKFNIFLNESFDKLNDSVGDLKNSFIDIDLDETELETSENGKLEQEPGKIIIENPSKIDAYNSKMRLGGEITIDPKYPEKQTHHIKKFNEFK